MFNLEQAIIEWRRQLAKGGFKSREALAELESHLRDDIEQHFRAGASEQEAFNTATKRLGQATALHTEYKKVKIVERLHLNSCYLYPLGVGMAFLLAIFLFCHFIVLPAATQLNQRYFQWLGIRANTQTSLSLSCWWTLGIAAALAMPFSLLLLPGSGRLNYKKVIRFRPGMMIINFFLAILLTSPEALTQAIMFVTLQLLCEGCLLIARFKNGREAKVA
jgi:Sec-independent protein translocase protein (TatC)